MTPRHRLGNISILKVQKFVLRLDDAVLILKSQVCCQEKVLSLSYRASCLADGNWCAVSALAHLWSPAPHTSARRGLSGALGGSPCRPRRADGRSRPRRCPARTRSCLRCRGWVRALCAELNVFARHAWEITSADLPAVVEKAARASSMQANPLPLSSEELLAVLSAAW